MLKRVCWPHEDAQNGEGNVIKVTVIQWDYELKVGKARVENYGPLVDVFITDYTQADLTIGVKKFYWYRPTEEQRRNRRAWSQYCSLGNLSKQRVAVDRMNCTGCGMQFAVIRLSDGGLCESCCERVVFER